MKKYINISVLLSSLIAIFTLVSCSKDVCHRTILQKGITLNATMGEDASRTVFDGKETIWADGDQMMVLISGNNYSSPSAHQFTIDTNDNNRFKNNTAEIDYTAKYNFYAVYPHTATINNNTTVTATIGAASQTQNGSSPAHIAALDPLTGCATEVLPSEVTIPMNHNAAVLAINITNNSEVEIAGIKSLQITAPDGVALCGAFDIDLSTGNITAKDYVSNSTIVTINDSGAVANAASFKVYAAIAPIVIEAGKSFEFIITTTDDVQHTFTKTFADGREIVAADLLTTTLTINKTEELPAKITYEFDFTNKANFPSGFPAKSANAPEGITYYSFGGIKLGFENNEGYNISSSDGTALSFKDVGKSSPAKIYLPQIAGYKIETMTILSGSTKHKAMLYDNNDEPIKMTTADGGYTSEKNLNEGTEITLYEPSIINYIKIIPKNSTANYLCKGIILNYIKE